MATYRKKIIGSEEYLKIIKRSEEKVAIQLPNFNIFETSIIEEISEDDKIRQYILYADDPYYLDEFKKVNMLISILKIGLFILNILFIKKVETDSKIIKTGVLSTRLALASALFLSIFSVDEFITVFIVVFVIVFFICYIPQMIKRYIRRN